MERYDGNVTDRVIAVDAPDSELERLLSIARSVDGDFFVSGEAWHDELGDQVFVDLSANWRTIEDLERKIRDQIEAQTGLSTFNEAEVDARYESAL